MVDHYRLQGEEFDKAYTYDVRSRTDETEISQQKVTSEKISVSRKDITRLEETEKPRYPKDLDIGRIVIEEIPEEKEEVAKHDIVHKDEVKPRRRDMETCYEVKTVPKKKVKEDTIKIGRLDINDYHTTSLESEHVQERAPYPGMVKKDDRVNLNSTLTIAIK